MSPRATSWSQDDDARLMAATDGRRVSGAEWRKLAAELGSGRTAAACKQRRNTLRQKAKGITTPPRQREHKGSINGRVERRDLMQAPPDPHTLPQHTSLTAAFFKDPLPGRSALDQKRAGLA